MQTIPGGGGSVITFSLPAGASGNYAQDFANAIATQTSVSTLPNETTVAGGLNVYYAAAALNTILTTGGDYSYVESAEASTITLAASNETLLGSALLTVVEQGTVGGERVTFIDGNNMFVGSSTGVGGDTISGGSGYDTISTGGGPSTVFSGQNTTIILNDTSAGGGDVAVLSEGNSTVFANGAADTIFAAATGTIVGGASAFLITTEAGTSVSLDVYGGTGGGTIFGTDGTDVTFGNASGSSLAYYVAGAGNETLNGSGASGGFAFFADTNSADSGSVVDSVTGGSGYDFFSTGTGTEDYTAGSGAALFDIASVAGGAITINDFSAADSVNFGGLSVADETSLVGSSSTVSDGSITVTLGNGTTVDFVGVSSLSGHLV